MNCPLKPISREEMNCPLRPIPREEMNCPLRPIPREEMNCPLRPIPREEMNCPLRPIPREEMNCPLRLIPREVCCLLVGCLTSQQHASVSQGRICSDNFACCHTEIEVADQTFHLTQSQYTDTGPTSPSADPITPGAWQGSHWSTNV